MFKIEKINIQVENKELIKDSTLILKRGIFTALTGENGTGKTTLMNCITMNQNFNFLSYQIDNQIITNKKDLQGKYLYLSQSNVLFNDMTIYQNLNLNQILYTNKILDKTNIQENNQELLKKYPKQLSGGEMNRIEFEKIHLAHYDLLLGDELFASLDQTSKIEFIKNLKKYVEKENCYCLIIIHDKELEQYFDEIYKIENQQLTLIKASNEIENYKNDLPSSFKVSMLFYKTFYKNKLLGNKKKYLFYSIIFSLIASSLIVSLRMMTWTDRYYQTNLEMLDSNNLIIDRVTYDLMDPYLPIDVFDFSLPFDNENLKDLYNLNSIEKITPRYEYRFNGGYLVANDLDLDKYCTTLLNDEGIYISQDMSEHYMSDDNQIELDIQVPVGMKVDEAVIYDTNETIQTKYTSTTDYHFKAKVKGILDEHYYELSQRFYGLVPSNMMKEIFDNCSQNTVLANDEIPYTYNMYNVQLKNTSNRSEFEKEVFQVDQHIVVTSMYDILTAIVSGKKQNVTLLGKRIISITLSFTILFLLAIHLMKNRKQKLENNLLQNLGLTKKQIFSLHSYISLMNSLLNTIIAVPISLGIIQLLVDHNYLVSSIRVPLNYPVIIIICLITCVIGHLLLEE